MNAPFQIDVMSGDDVAAVASIEGATHVAEDDLRAELERPWARLWVARETGAFAVAFLLGWHVVDELHVLNLTTRADRRRQGIGRALMHQALNYARDKSVRCLLLEVRRSNVAAIALYRAVGFSATRVRAHYYSDGEDGVEMALALDQATGNVVSNPDAVEV